MKKPISKDKWVWMPHAGHLIVGHQCRFHLATKVGRFLVSTVGEYWPERAVREIHAEVHDPKWLTANKHLRGDAFDHAYFKHFGFEELGTDRTYETMVFRVQRVRPNEDQCCPWRMISGMDIASDGYSKSAAAFKGHLAMCKKFANK